MTRTVNALKAAVLPDLQREIREIASAREEDEPDETLRRRALTKRESLTCPALYDEHRNIR